MANGQRVGYIRVSLEGQNTERQLDGVQIDRCFTDKASGKDIQRPQLEALVGNPVEDERDSGLKPNTIPL